MGDLLERLGEWGTGWRSWESGKLVGDVPSKFSCKFPFQVPLSMCVCLFVKMFVCFKTGFPHPVYFLFLPFVFKQPST